MSEAEPLSRALRSYMKRTRSTVRAVASACDLNVATVHTVMTGERMPNYLTLKKLHDETGIPYSAMFGEMR